MRVCESHKVKAVVTLKNSVDDSEHDLCSECYEAFQLIVSGAFFADAQAEEASPKRGRPRKEATT